MKAPAAKSNKETATQRNPRWGGNEIRECAVARFCLILFIFFNGDRGNGDEVSYAKERKIDGIMIDTQFVRAFISLSELLCRLEVTIPSSRPDSNEVTNE